jgi:tryptophan 2,3-dioxygenase
MAITYSEYLKVPELLSLQTPQSEPAEHDEMLFITIHQVYELWFKTILHEFERIKTEFSAGSLFSTIASFQRVRTIMKTLVSQLDIMETMTPISFASFRDRLTTASGFQSYQFRLLEFVLGYRRPEMLKYYGNNPIAQDLLKSELTRRSVTDHFYDMLEQNGAEVPRALRERDLSQPNTTDPVIQQGLLKLYKDRGDLAILFEVMTDFDEGFQEWRYRHVMLVQRTIGDKVGTGGSPGVAFLKQGLFNAIFPDLWEIRQEF